MFALLLGWLGLVCSLSLERKHLEEFSTGSIQVIKILSKVGEDTRISFRDKLNQTNRQLVDFFIASHPNTQQELGQRFYDGLHLDAVLSHLPSYTTTLQLHLTSGGAQTKPSILQKLKERFNDSAYQYTLLYYSGNSDSFTGGWRVAEKGLTPQSNWGSLILYRDIANLWADRADVINSKMLLIMIDASYSGFWSKRCYEESDFEDISVLASTKVAEQTHDIGIGGYLTYNVMEAARPFGGNSNFVREDAIEAKQRISAMGVSPFLEALYRARLLYGNWTQVFNNVDKNAPEIW